MEKKPERRQSLKDRVAAQNRGKPAAASGKDEPSIVAKQAKQHEELGKETKPRPGKEDQEKVHEPHPSTTQPQQDFLQPIAEGKENAVSRQMVSAKDDEQSPTHAESPVKKRNVEGKDDKDLRGAASVVVERSVKSGPTEERLTTEAPKAEALSPGAAFANRKEELRPLDGPERPTAERRTFSEDAKADARDPFSQESKPDARASFIDDSKADAISPVLSLADRKEESKTYESPERQKAEQEQVAESFTAEASPSLASRIEESKTLDSREGLKQEDRTVTENFKAETSSPAVGSYSQHEESDTLDSQQQSKSIDDPKPKNSGATSKSFEGAKQEEKGSEIAEGSTGSAVGGTGKEESQESKKTAGDTPQILPQSAQSGNGEDLDKQRKQKKTIQDTKEGITKQLSKKNFPDQEEEENKEPKGNAVYLIDSSGLSKGGLDGKTHPPVADRPKSLKEAREESKRRRSSHREGSKGNVAATDESKATLDADESKATLDAKESNKGSGPKVNPLTSNTKEDSKIAQTSNSRDDPKPDSTEETQEPQKKGGYTSGIPPKVDGASTSTLIVAKEGEEAQENVLGKASTSMPSGSTLKQEEPTSATSFTVTADNDVPQIPNDKEEPTVRDEKEDNLLSTASDLASATRDKRSNNYQPKPSTRQPDTEVRKAALAKDGWKKKDGGGSKDRGFLADLPASNDEVSDSRADGGGMSNKEADGSWIAEGRFETNGDEGQPAAQGTLSEGGNRGVETFQPLKGAAPSIALTAETAKSTQEAKHSKSIPTKEEGTVDQRNVKVDKTLATQEIDKQDKEDKIAKEKTVEEIDSQRKRDKANKPTKQAFTGSSSDKQSKEPVKSEDNRESDKKMMTRPGDEEGERARPERVTRSTPPQSAPPIQHGETGILGNSSTNGGNKQSKHGELMPGEPDASSETESQEEEDDNLELDNNDDKKEPESDNQDKGEPVVVPRTPQETQDLYVKKFLGLVRRQIVPGAAEGMDAQSARTTSQTTAYGFHLVDVTRWPDAKAFADGDSTYRLRVFLYDRQSKVFLSTQKDLSGLSRSKAQKTILIDDYLFFLSAGERKKSVYAVIELISGVKDSSGITRSESGLGWAMFPIFCDGSLPDLSHQWQTGHETLEMIQVLQGSPRALFGLTSEAKDFPDVKGCVLRISRCRVPEYARLAPLLNENELFTKADAIPGLRPNVLGVGKRKIPCLQQQQHRRLLPTLAFEFLPRTTMEVESVSVTIRHRVEFEEALIENIIYARAQNDATQVAADISHRVLKIGLHNGRRWVTRALTLPLKLKSSVSDTLLSSGALKLRGCVPDPNFVLVGMVQYTILISETKIEGIILKTKTPKDTEPALAVVACGGAVLHDGKEVAVSPDTLTKLKMFDIGLMRKFTEAPIFSIPGRPPTSGHHKITIECQLKWEDIEVEEEQQVPAQLATTTANKKRPKDDEKTTQPKKPELSPRSMETNVGPNQRAPVELKPSGSQQPVRDLTMPYREFSRAAMTTLNRLGVAESVSGGIASTHSSASDVTVQYSPLSVELEAQDSCAIHEVTVHLAGFRRSLEKNAPSPKRLFFTFQFYNYVPTRTETLSCLPSHDKDLNLAAPFAEFPADGSSQFGPAEILVRKEQSQEPAGLAVKFTIDTSAHGTNESIAFAEYLYYKSLQIDVWDGDSLFHLGLCRLPLRRLMRQGQKSVKFGGEFDVFESSSYSFPATKAVGKVLLLASNLGVRSFKETEAGRNTPITMIGQPDEGDTFARLALQWRLQSEGKERESKGAIFRTRARAKPITQLQTNTPEEKERIEEAPIEALCISTDEIYQYFQKHRLGEHRVDYRELVRLAKEAGSRGERKQSLIQRLRNVLKKRGIKYAAILDLFASYDKEKVGFVSMKCALECFQNLGSSCEISIADLNLLLESYSPLNRENVVQYRRLLAELYPRSKNNKEDAENDPNLQALRDILRTAASKGVTMEKLFFHFDKDGSGSVDEKEFEQVLGALSDQFRPTVMDRHRIFRHIDKDRSGRITFQEFKSFLEQSKAVEDQVSAADQLRKVLEVCQNKGVDLKDLFHHFDGDGGGFVDVKEFAEVLAGLGPEFTLSPEKVSALFKEIDDDHSGRISYAEFNDFVEIGATHSHRKAQGKEKSADKLRKILKTCEERGASVKELFSHFDRDGGGTVDLTEFAQVLDGLGPGLQLGKNEAEEIFKSIDDDNSGKISFTELKAFIQGGATHSQRKDNAEPSTADQVQRILKACETKGVSLKDLFRHFDKDGGGSVDCTEFGQVLAGLGVDFKLQREEMMKIFRQIDEDNSGKVSYDEFKAFVNGGTSRSQSAATAPNPIEQLKSILLTCEEKGVSVRDLFTHFDKDGGGSVDLKEFAQVLAALGADFTLKEEAVANIFRRIDRDGDGTICYEEFRDYMQGGSIAGLDKTGASGHSALARLRDTLKQAGQKGISVEDLFKYFDKNGGGSVDFEEFGLVLNGLGSEFPLTVEDVRGIFCTIDIDKNGRISYGEFRSFVDGNCNGPPAQQKAESASDQLRQVIKTASDKGVHLEDLFRHFDHDHGGSVDFVEFEKVVAGLGQDFKLGKAAIRDIFQELDRDKSGRITYDEFKAFIESTPSPSQEMGGDKSSDVAPLHQLRNVLKSAEEKGISVKNLFTHFDKDGGGSVDLKEFMQVLSGLGPDFKLTDEQVEVIYKNIDTDGNGKITYEEFQQFVQPGVRSGPEANGKRGQSASAITTNMRSTDLRKLLKAASEKGLNVKEFFDHFDKDRNGSVDVEEFGQVLLGLGVDFSLEQEEVAMLFRQIDRDNSGKITCQEFMLFLEGDKPMSIESVSQSTFLVESLQRLLSGSMEKGLNVKDLFAHFDNDGDGSVDAAEFEQVLHGLGPTLKLSGDEASKLFSQIDRDRSGKVTYEEFLHFVNESASQRKTTSAKSEDPKSEKSSCRRTTVSDKVRQLMKSAEAKGVSLKDLFAHFDLNGGGWLDIKEFSQVLRGLGPDYTLNEEDMNALFKEIDDDSNGKICYEEFKTFINSQPLVKATKVESSNGYRTKAALSKGNHGNKEKAGCSRTSTENLQSILRTAQEKGVNIKDLFSHFDKDGSAAVDRAEFAQFLAGLGSASFELGDEEIQMVFGQIDVDGDGKINLAEFLQFVDNGVPVKGGEKTHKGSSMAALQLKEALLAAQTKGADLKDLFCLLKSGNPKEYDKLASLLSDMGIDLNLKADEALSAFKESVIAPGKVTEGSGSLTSSFEAFVAFVQSNDERIVHMKGNDSRSWTIKEVVEVADALGISFKALVLELAARDGGTFTQHHLELALRSLGGELEKASKEIASCLFKELGGDGKNRLAEKSVEAFFSHSSTVDGPTGSARDFTSLLQGAAGLELQELFSHFTQGAGGRMSFEGFQDFMRSLPDWNEDIYPQLTYIFAQLDTDGDGFLLFRDLFNPHIEKELEDRRRGLLRDVRTKMDEMQLGRQNLGTDKVSLAEFTRHCKRLFHLSNSESLLLFELVDKEFSGFGRLSDLPKAIEEVLSDQRGVKDMGLRIERKLRKQISKLSMKGFDVSSVLASYDPSGTGSIFLSDFSQLLFKLGFTLTDTIEASPSHSNSRYSSSLLHRQRTRVAALKRAMEKRKQSNTSEARSSIYSAVHPSPSSVPEFQPVGSKERDMERLKWHREKSKAKLVTSLLTQSLTTEFQLFPTFGKPEYFELHIRNPFPAEHRFSLSFGDPELHLIRNVEEWTYFRSNVRPAFGSAGLQPLEREMIDDKCELLLEGNGELWVPFVFMSMRHSAEEREKDERVCPIVLQSAIHGHNIAIFKIRVHPQPFVVDRHLHLHKGPGEIVKEQIALDTPSSSSACRGRPKYAFCSEKEVLVEVYGAKAGDVPLDHGPNTLEIKTRTPRTPIEESFYVLLYEDHFHARLCAIWRVTLHVSNRIHINAVVGETSSSELAFDCDGAPQYVSFYSSLPGEAQMRPSGPVRMAPSSLNFVELRFRPLTAGYRTFLVHATDAGAGTLLSSWIVASSAYPPQVTKKFDLILDRGKEHSKRIAYHNRWDNLRTFHLSSSDESLVRLKTHTLLLHGGGEGFIRLSFPLRREKVSASVYLFVNDEEGQSEDCYQLNLTWS